MESSTPRQHKLFWGSSYDRGLQYLLFMWPDIIKTFPDAELHVAYGWDLFLKFATGNAERMAWKKSMDKLLSQKNIFHYGRVGKEKLSSIRKSCGIWAYTTEFKEINCITALESQRDGLVPVTLPLAALQETAKEGILINGDIKGIKTQKKYLTQLLSLMGNKEQWKKLSQKCERFAKDYYWSGIANNWIRVFGEKTFEPKVTIITPTIREGFWNIMAYNLSKQTYKNFEWIVVDDHKEDRTVVANKYAKKYNLEVQYLRGDKSLSRASKYPRRCGLVRANNIAWKASKGELLVWIQDFIIIPENGIEQLVDLYRYNPDALIAPTDIYYNCLEPNQKNKEDWWDGDPNILLGESWRNVRNTFQGIRETDNPFDFEINYGAIPKKILNELNGFWEFMDDGLGYDNTNIAYVALKKGYRILLDDSNVASCINLWPFIGGTDQNVSSRERILNTPRWNWYVKQVETGKLPIVRNEKVDDSIHLHFEVPKEIKNEDCAKWINAHAEEISQTWEDYKQ